MVKGESRWLPWYLTAVISGGAVVIATALFRYGPTFIVHARFWVLVAFICWLELPARAVRRGHHGNAEITISTTFAFALLILEGGAAAIVANAIGAVMNGVLARKAWYKTAFNAAQISLALFAGSLVLWAMPNAHYAPLTDPNILFQPIEIPALALAGLAFFAVNFLLLETVLTLVEGVPFRSYLRNDLRYEGIPVTMMLTIAPLIAVVAHYSLWLLPLLVIPVLGGFRIAKLYYTTEYQALHDALTGLPNRVLFQDRLAQALTLIARNQTLVGVIVLDLDRFKEVNDILGHPAGDELLRAVGPRLQGALRESDTVARLGGDEFGVILRGLSDVEAATNIAIKLQEALQESIFVEGVNLETPASMGVAVAPLHGTSADLLLRRADAAMYEAKQTMVGYALFSPPEDEDRAGRLALSNQLRVAIGRGELVLAYQPKVDVIDGQVLGVEALVRWEHPERGVLGAGEVVPIAEATGLVQPLTLHVLDRALNQVSRWRKIGLNLGVAVNVSVQNLLNQHLLLHLYEALDHWDVDPECLTLEITESQIMHNPVRSLEMLQALKGMGVGLSVDDFGTGTSALSRLKEMPVDELKIDRGFVQGVTEDFKDQAVVQAITTLGNELGLRVVAEGVETAATLDLVREYGCHIAQGYFVAPPLDGNTFSGWHMGWTPSDTTVWD